jgi:hypothetical protein
LYSSEGVLANTWQWIVVLFCDTLRHSPWNVFA